MFGQIYPSMFKCPKHDFREAFCHKKTALQPEHLFRTWSVSVKRKRETDKTVISGFMPTGLYLSFKPKLCSIFYGYFLDVWIYKQACLKTIQVRKKSTPLFIFWIVYAWLAYIPIANTIRYSFFETKDFAVAFWSFATWHCTMGNYDKNHGYSGCWECLALLLRASLLNLIQVQKVADVI